MAQAVGASIMDRVGEQLRKYAHLDCVFPRGDLRNSAGLEHITRPRACVVAQEFNIPYVKAFIGLEYFRYPQFGGIIVPNEARRYILQYMDIKAENANRAIQLREARMRGRQDKAIHREVCRQIPNIRERTRIRYIENVELVRSHMNRAFMDKIDKTNNESKDNLLAKVRSYGIPVRKTYTRTSLLVIICYEEHCHFIERQFRIICVYTSTPWGVPGDVVMPDTLSSKLKYFQQIEEFVRTESMLVALQKMFAIRAAMRAIENSQVVPRYLEITKRFKSIAQDWFWLDEPHSFNDHATICNDVKEYIRRGIEIPRTHERKLEIIDSIGRRAGDIEGLLDYGRYTSNLPKLSLDVIRLIVECDSSIGVRFAQAFPIYAIPMLCDGIISQVPRWDLKI